MSFKMSGNVIEIKSVVDSVKGKELLEVVCELEGMLIELESKLNSKKFKKSRKEEVLEILEEGKLLEIKNIGERINITNRNVSSILSYLRDDGFIIGKIGRGVGKLKLMGKVDDKGIEYGFNKEKGYYIEE